MPKNTACPACPGVPWSVPPVTDPITDEEIAFAHLILSGTMTDRQAAEAVGLNPDIAADTKAKPRVRAYMIEHRAPVREKPVDQEAVDGLRKLNIGRDQILNRLWELATLSHEATRGSITGQMKAMAMIVAIEGLIPDRRLSTFQTQSANPPVKPDIYESAWLRERQHPSADKETTDAVVATEAQTDAPPPSHPNLEPSQPTSPDPLIPQGFNWVPLATNGGFDAALHAAGSSRKPFSIQKGRFGRHR